MSQFQQEQYYGQPAMDPSQMAPKMSSMAVTALVMSLIGIIPCCGLLTGPLGALLGVISVVRIGSNPSLKGKGLAVIAILLGLVFTAAQIGGGYYLYDEFARPIVEGPRKALSAASNGDIAKFKSYFVGAGATASDEEAKAFIDELERRYGKFVTSKIAESAQAPPPGSQDPHIVMPYLFQFANQDVDGEATYEMADKMTGQLVRKWSEVVIHDPSQGDLVYPLPTSNPTSGTGTDIEGTGQAIEDATKYPSGGGEDDTTGGSSGP